jgi:hypothetical protein
MLSPLCSPRGDKVFPPRSSRGDGSNFASARAVDAALG